ncbi:DUF3375 domain-containing protein [Variovorax sp. NFACC27]|uniref:DUF3375 domain-containing protein n=1 Tax=unclassified Variovorax TaxID=663243 RepID=UPI00089C1756|nr:Protein of unknown function [Variovorax sp. NFACC28]SEG99199.1 Protein of unknown function [Variovorax sp. NFACC29]SFE19139.1 Protein of unknown function [Variovorax sp. NFACC26]SFH24840.1 Protein of unknown function [Variovorax sp. NFACC27]
MSEASTVAQFQDLKRLREAAAWKLLGADTAPLICTCLLALFPGTGSRQVNAAALHAKLDLLLESLRAAGVDPSQPAQGYAADWVTNGWLRRDFPQGAQEEHYSLTVAAGSALRIVESWRPSVTDTTGGLRLESRLASVRSLMRQLDQFTDDNPQARLASLYAEKAAIEYRIQETEAGRMVSIDEDRAVEWAREIIGQGDQLQGDFDRVRDQFEVIHLDLRKRLLQHEGSRRELVEQLLDGIDIIRETDAGRAFQAFWNLLMDASEVTIFEETAHALANRSFAARLSFDERLALETLKARLLAQATDVHEVRGRFVSGLHAYVRSREYAQQRRIMQLVSQAHRAATALIGHVRANEEIGFNFDRTSAAVRSLSQWSLHDPAASAVATRIEDHVPELASPEELRLMVLRAEVDMRAIKKNVREYLSAVGHASTGDFLKAYPATQGLGTVLGYLQLTIRHGKAEEDSELLQWTGMDGELRAAWAPRYTVTKECIDAIK